MCKAKEVNRELGLVTFQTDAGSIMLDKSGKIRAEIGFTTPAEMKGCHRKLNAILKDNK